MILCEGRLDGTQRLQGIRQKQARTHFLDWTFHQLIGGSIKPKSKRPGLASERQYMWHPFVHRSDQYEPCRGRQAPPHGIIIKSKQGPESANPLCWPITMNECPATSTYSFGSLLSFQISCILFYGGSVKDCVINYSLLTLTLLAAAERTAQQQRRRRRRYRGNSNIHLLEHSSISPSGDCHSNATDGGEEEQEQQAQQQPNDDVFQSPTISSCILSFVFTIVFQITLCIVVGCMGISIVWCAAAGWIATGIVLLRGQPRPRDDTCNWLLWLPAAVILSLDVVGILYYAVTTEAITTVAHGCAIAMGCVLFYVSAATSFGCCARESLNPHH